MTALAGITDRQRTFANSIAFGVLGAGLVYLGRRVRPGIVATIASTAGYTLLSRSITTVVGTALAPED
jgi:hypothetical protein